jgi:hypothetical protein
VTGVPINRRPPTDTVDVINECAESIRETARLRLRSAFPKLFDEGAPLAAALEKALEELAHEVRMPIANAIMATNPLARKRAKKRAR